MMNLPALSAVGYDDVHTLLARPASLTRAQGGTLERIACAFAGCTSRQIRDTIQYALAELANASGACAAILLSADQAPILGYAPPRPPARPADRAQENSEDDTLGDFAQHTPDRNWLDAANHLRTTLSVDDLIPLSDWVLPRSLEPSRRGIIKACIAPPALIALRWETDADGTSAAPMEGLQTAEIVTLLRRACAIIVAAQQREDMAEERRVLLRRLSERQSLDIASTTAMALAHNLNNVLAAMLGQTEIAIDSVRHQPRGLNAVMSIRNATERAAELIEGILGFGQHDIPSRAVTMSQLCAETLSLIRPAIPEAITLSLDDQSHAAQVHGRMAELQQILFNLVRNAAQAIPDRGEITLRTTIRDGDPRRVMQIGALTARAYVVVCVQDTGIGIDPKLYATIFRPFHTTKPAGTGLGLATVADIVDAHDGAIALSRPAQPRSQDAYQGPGTIFEVWLPLCTKDTRSFGMMRGDGEPVLLVAPESNRERFEDIVAALGYEPESQNGIDTALATLARDPHAPEAILLCVEDADLNGGLIAAERFHPAPRPLRLAV